ncbi:MAG: recombinase RecA [Elusimicrobia bacterium]|nr:recombinase RecA [Elusimicrobiota bacterium]MDE2426712.1 recombinase RecA [Elusimicrobiota bacterium]
MANEGAKGKALDLALAQIEKAYGREAIMKLGDRAKKINVETIPTGILSLDLALGVGGLPRGRIIEIYGPESSGKTTLALQAVAQAQKRGGAAAYIDAEHAMDPAYTKQLGVDVDSLLIAQPDCGEEALEITEKLVRSSALDVIVVDSVAALVPKAEIEGEMGDSHMGLQARLMSQALRKLTAAVAQSKTILIFINQIRNKIGVMFGNPETTTGGLALKFYATVRMDIRRIENIKDGDVVVGARARVKIVKNKVAPPYRTAEFEMIHGYGVSREGCLIDMGVEGQLLEKSGSWFLYKGERLGQGRENAKATLKQRTELADKLEQELRAKYLVGPAAQAAAEAAAEREEAAAKAELEAAEKSSAKPAKAAR